MKNFQLIHQVDNYYEGCISGKIGSEGKVLFAEAKTEISLSALMRELRKEGGDAAAKRFLEVYKSCFDLLVCNDVEDISAKCMEMALELFKRTYQGKLKKEAMVVNASNAQMVGQYLANIIRFTVGRISSKSRPKSIETLKHKIYQLNESELANKKLPASSSMGQAITFVKHVLFNHDPRYIREVLNYITQYL